jgi:two-component system sensor histidine kinase KdpD
MSSSTVTYMRTEDVLGDPVPTRPAPRRGLGPRRFLVGLALTAIGLPLLTVLLEGARDTLSLESDLMLYLLAVVVIAVVGGIAVAVLAAIFAAALANWYFVAPLHTLDISQGEQLLALFVFVVVATTVSAAVEVATRRARAAAKAAAQAETLSSLAGAELDEAETLQDLLGRARETFDMQSVTLRVRDRSSDSWRDVESAGPRVVDEVAPLRFDVAIGNDLRLVGRGRALFAEDQRVLQAFAAAAETAYSGRLLAERARQAQGLADVDRQRVALLNAVGHDLRTPLAGIKAGVSSLRQTDVSWSDEQRDDLLATIEQSADRLDGIVANLLDASRLQAGSVPVRSRAVALEEVVARALLTLPEAQERVAVDVPEEMPMVEADPGLLERIVINLLDNALRHAGEGHVEISATAGETAAKLLVVDHGSGVAPERREQLFEPFQRLDDRSVGGVGLGLAVARGFAEAMGGKLIADNSPGGGLTMRLRLRLAGRDEPL